ncbi:MULTISPECIES: thioredoxin family protein [unclassified Paenibacillus]|uniref:thioredoxin family protein n=1 Tax=unclassified Paenibacillus TaxID=185978 RepID=UPI0010519516|nr:MULTISPECIES: thioredoxin family protein [unclassified Paenibacillus]NIK70203.1 thioredoxin-like negative regulator of GroEL [Paenibacillus sp. BK720]TCM98030.1 thioredoxin [Paenibacillus sp. BK033]
MNKLTTDAAFREAVQGDGVTVVVFKTTWCPDCHYIDPFMPDVEQQYSGKISFHEIDRDELPDLCSELNILGIPSFIAFRNGKELIRYVNKLRKTREEIEQFLDRAVQVADALPQDE